MLKRLFRKAKIEEPGRLVPSGNKVSVLFVCMANICRSPTAQGVFQQMIETESLADKIELDSAGTITSHLGKAPDSRAQDAAQERGYDLSQYRSRLIEPIDCEEYDFIIVMDQINLLDVRSVCPKRCWRKINMLMDFLPGHRGEDVPDPYAGDKDDFELVVNLVESASRNLLGYIRKTHKI